MELAHLALDGQRTLTFFNDNYRTHFSGIKRLNPGDSVVFTDADGNVFSYEVAEIETVGGYDIEKMEAGDWDLTLFTCTNKGKARAAVRCREIEE